MPDSNHPPAACSRSSLVDLLRRPARHRSLPRADPARAHRPRRPRPGRRRRAARPPAASRSRCAPTRPGRASAPASSCASASRSTASAGRAPTRRPAPSTRADGAARADGHRRTPRGSSRATCTRTRARARSSTSAQAQGDFVLPSARPERLVLISGGSGITPVLSMLRTLCDEGHDGEITFLHYARTADDWLYRAELERARRAATPTSRVEYVATREGGGARERAHSIERLIGDARRRRRAAVCGPPALIEAVARASWPDARARSRRDASRRRASTLAGAARRAATLRFLRSGRRPPIADRHAARAGRGRRA